MKCFRQGTAIAIASLFTIRFTVGVATAEELKTAEQIMGFSSAKVATYKTWSADYTQSMSMLGAPMTINGRLLQKLPRKMWMQLEMPMMGQKGKMTMILGDDGIMWQIMETGPQPQIMKVDVSRIYSNTMNLTGAKFNPIDQMDPSKHWVATKEMYDYRKVDARERDGQGVYVMEGLLKPGAVTNQQMAAEAARVGKMRASIGQSDGFIHRLEQYDKSLTNVIMTMEFKNLKFNVDIPDATFIYRPPADAKVTDMTPMVEMQMRARQGAGTPAAPESVPPPAPPVPKTK
jgi:outer membrane lipoprotein-sorting protein